MVVKGSNAMCEKGGTGAAGLWHGTDCTWARDVRPYQKQVGAGTSREWGDPDYVYANWTEFRDSGAFTWVPLDASTPIPAATGSPTSECGRKRQTHSASRGGAYGNADYAAGIGSEFTVEAWFSGADLKFDRCQFIRSEAEPPGGSYNPSTDERCLSDEDLEWPRRVNRHKYSSWPQRSKSNHHGGQFTLFAIAEPDAMAVWPTSNPPRGQEALLSNLCQQGSTDRVGLGMALVVNQNGCFQLVLGQQSGDPDGSCVAVPNAAVVRDACPSRSQRLDNNGDGTPTTWTQRTTDQYVRCIEYSNSSDNRDDSATCLRHIEYPFTHFNHHPVKAWIDSLESHPTRPHHVAVVVNRLDNRGLGEEYTARDAVQPGQDDFTPKYSIYVDGQLFTSSTLANAGFLSAHPDAASPPYNEFNDDFKRHEQSRNDANANMLLVAPNLSSIITPSMRLYVGTDGLQSDAWLVAETDGVPVDVNEVEGASQTRLPRDGTYNFNYVKGGNPMRNAHPFIGSVEMVALHGSAFTPAQARTQYSAGLPNRPPRVAAGLVALSVREGECGQLALNATDDDVQRYGKQQPLTWKVVVSENPVYSDAACTQETVDDETYAALYYKGLSPDFSGRFGQMAVRAYDGMLYSEQRFVELSVTSVVDGPIVESLIVQTLPSVTVAMPFSAMSVDKPGLAAESGFRLKIVKPPKVGVLFDGDVRLEPLEAGDITKNSTLFYLSEGAHLTEDAVAYVDTFSVRGVAPSGQNDAVSPVEATGTVNVLRALQTATSSVSGREDETFIITLRAFYIGEPNDIQFEVVDHSDDLTLRQKNTEAEISGESEEAPVALTSTVFQCSSELNYYLCAQVLARPAANHFGRRLQSTSQEKHSASLSYRVAAGGFTTATALVSVLIDSVLDPLPSFRCVDQLNFSRLSTNVVTPLSNGNVNFTDVDGGSGDAGWAYLRVKTESYEFGVALDVGNKYTQPPLVTQVQVSPQQAYDMVGFCPSLCDTEVSSAASADLGYKCGGCLSGASGARGLTLFEAVLAPDLLQSALDSVQIAINAQGFVSSWTGAVTLTVVKFDNSTRAGFMSNCTISLYAYAEDYFDTYASEGICYFHSSVELLERAIQLAVCAWFWWDGPIFWWLRGNELTGGILTQSLLGVWIIGIFLLVGLCCTLACCCAARLFVRTVLDTLRRLRGLLDRDEIARRGARVEATLPQVICLYGTCYGGCFCCPSLCLPRRENDVSTRGWLRRLLWLATCKLLPVLRPKDEPLGPTWREWVWDWLSWLLCRGCGLLPSMATWESKRDARAAQEARQAKKSVRDDVPLLPPLNLRG